MNRSTISQFLAGEIPASALPDPQWGPNGQLVYERTYSRPLFDSQGNRKPWTIGDTEGRTSEVWAETCRRIVLGNTSLSPETLADHEAEELFEAIFEMRLVPGGRHLWVDGTGLPYSRNCFGQETEVITRDGVRRIGDIVGTPVEIIDGNGKWVEAEAKSFGQQALLKLTLSRGPAETKTIYTTADHGWFVHTNSKADRFKRVETSALTPGQQLVARVAKSNVRKGQTEMSPVGIQHGFVYGDGSIMGGRTGYAVAYFCGDKDQQMLRWFPNQTVKERADGVLYVGNMPRYFKSAPSLDEAPSVLYGFLAGYFAADGSVGSGGSCTITSSNRSNLELVRDICNRLGIATYSIRHQARQGYGDQPTSLYWLTIDKHHLTEDFFLIEAHRRLWKESGGERSRRQARDTNAWRVVAVEPSDRFEEVYCFEVPTTHSFVLDGNILTSNCWAAPMGRRTSGHFRFLGSRLFEGGGVGANYSNDMLAATTPVMRQVTVRIMCREDHPDIEAVMAASNGNWASANEILAMRANPAAEFLRVEDSREGWVDAWGRLIDLSCSTSGPGFLFVDVSDVRQAGAELVTYGGTASGPEPLVLSLVSISHTLHEAHGRRLRSLEAMDIDHEIASAVVAGGTRRSARLATKHWGDDDIFEFIGCKLDPSRHWSTNISVETDDAFYAALDDAMDPRHAHARMVLSLVAMGMSTNGEPGLLNSSQMSVGEKNPVRTTNPCVTGDTLVLTKRGEFSVDDLLGTGAVALMVHGRPYLSDNKGFFCTGTKKVIGLHVGGRVLRLTPDHRVMTPNGWVKAGRLAVGFPVILDNGSNDPAHLATSEDARQRLVSEGVEAVIEEITDEGVENVYDIQVPGLNAFVAQGVVVHNCGEVPLETEGDEFGEACNIGSVNLDAVRTDDDLALRTFWLLGRFLYRSTLKPYPGADASTIEARNRRIGAGLMGLQEWCLAHGTKLSQAPANPELTEKMHRFRKAVRSGADELADALGTPRSVKVTAIAPNGSTAKLAGVGCGIHPVLAKYAEQRIRFSVHDPKVEEMRAKGYPVEPCVYAPTTTVVVTIPTRDIILDKGFEEDMIEQADDICLDDFLALQQWVTDTFCCGDDGNAVSATASIPAEMNPNDIAKILAKRGRKLKGTTVFPSMSRPQQPVTIITREDYEAMKSFCEVMSGQLADDCSTGACPVR